MEENENSENIQDVADLDQNDISTKVDEVVENNNENENETNEGTNTAEQHENVEDSNVQSKEDNRAARAARIRAEQEAQKKIDEAYAKGLKDAKLKGTFGKTNPYTGQVIEDDFDAQEYLEMQEIAEQGGDPVLGYASKLKQKEREQLQNQNKAQEEMRKEQLNFELDEFISSHPNLDVQKLLSDPNFTIFAEGKVGNKSISQIYDDYNKVINHYEKSAEKKAQGIIANNNASPGSLKGGKQEQLDYGKMSSADFQKAKEKILNSRYE